MFPHIFSYETWTKQNSEFSSVIVEGVEIGVEVY